VNKFFINLFAFLLALLLVIGLLYFSRNGILNYYAKPLQDSLQRTLSLQNDLESGKIVVFGSSELVIYPNQKFLPQNFFNNDLKLPLRAQGNEGQQTFVIMAQLAACDNEIVRNNATFRGIDEDLLRRRLMKHKNLLKRSRAKNRKMIPRECRVVKLQSGQGTVLRKVKSSGIEGIGAART
jgi:hypothetical protein